MPYHSKKGPGAQGKRWPKYRYCFSCLKVRGGSLLAIELNPPFLIAWHYSIGINPGRQHLACEHRLRRRCCRLKRLQWAQVLDRLLPLQGAKKKNPNKNTNSSPLTRGTITEKVRKLLENCNFRTFSAIFPFFGGCWEFVFFGNSWGFSGVFCTL